MTTFSESTNALSFAIESTLNMRRVTLSLFSSIVSKVQKQMQEKQHVKYPLYVYVCLIFNLQGFNALLLIPITFFHQFLSSKTYFQWFVSVLVACS